jgi:3-keto-disaccharide hydrolase
MLRSRTSAIVSMLVFTAASALSVLSQSNQQLAPFPPPKAEPSVVTPGKNNSDPPSDAIVLFGGKDLSEWRSVKDGVEPKWQVKDGYMEVTPQSGDIATRQEFGDCQLHIEWASPAEVKGEGQGRGNSGVFLMERYEVQVLDSYSNKTYYHGQAGAIYNQYAPMVNASRNPGEWQSYDIIFKAPKFDEQGKVTERARITVLHNGVLIQNNVEIYGITWHDKPTLYIAHGPTASLKLQDHGDRVRYRNIWIRKL